MQSWTGAARSPARLFADAGADRRLHVLLARVGIGAVAGGQHGRDAVRPADAVILRCVDAALVRRVQPGGPDVTGPVDLPVEAPADVFTAPTAVHAGVRGADRRAQP